MLIQDLGIIGYREAWAEQERIHGEVLAGAQERILLLEHPPVITFGRRPGGEQHLIAAADQLAKIGVELVQSDRGGDVTFHGPGQLVAYPIVRLADHDLLVGNYVRLLLDAVIDAVGQLGVHAERDPTAIGVWAKRADGIAAKLCALGVRIRRGVSLHGIALNVTTDLQYFNLIVPCGLAGRPVTSLEQLLGRGVPSMEVVKQVVGERLRSHLEAARRKDREPVR